MNKIETAKILGILLAAYPHTKTTEMTSAVWESALADLDYDLVDIAVMRLVLTEFDFMPSIAKVRAAAIEQRDGIRRAPGDAWGDVRAAIGSVGRYRLPTFDDPLVARCVDIFGWRELCDAPSGDMSIRARFMDTYRDLANTDDRARRTQGLLPAPPPMMRLGGRSLGDVLRLAAAPAESIDDDDNELPWENES